MTSRVKEKDLLPVVFPVPVTPYNRKTMPDKIPRSKDSPQGSKYYPDCSYIAPISCVYPSGVHASDVQTSGELTSGMHASVSPPCFVYHNVPKFLGKIRTNPWIVNLDRHKTVAKTADGNARISNCIKPNARLNCTNARLNCTNARPNARLTVTAALHDTTNNCC